MLSLPSGLALEHGFADGFGTTNDGTDSSDSMRSENCVRRRVDVVNGACVQVNTCPVTIHRRSRFASGAGCPSTWHSMESRSESRWSTTAKAQGKQRSSPSAAMGAGERSSTVGLRLSRGRSDSASVFRLERSDTG